MRSALLFCLLAVPCFGDIVAIDAGSALENSCTGSKYGSAQQPDMANQAAPFNTLRYGVNGAAIQCTIPAPIGTCTVTLQFFENRPAVATPALPASGPGLRVFTVSINGSAVLAVDIFAAVGAQAPYMLTSGPITVSDGLLHVNFNGLKGNPSVSGIIRDCTPAPVPPSGITGVECLSLVAANTDGNQPAITLAVTLPDGTCLPVRMLTSTGLVGRITSVSGMSAANADNLSPSGAFTSGLIWLLIAPLSAPDNSAPLGFPVQ